MASSLNGLTVGNSSLPENLIESPTRSESMCYFRDEMSLQYSPMSEDSDDARYNEGRFPSSPSDICHSADLRRAALLRSVQMRVHPVAPPAYELSFSPEHEPTGNIEAQEHPCLCVKPIVNDCECPHPQQGQNSFAEDFCC